MTSKLHLPLFVVASLVAVLLSWAVLDHLVAGIPAAAAAAPGIADEPAALAAATPQLPDPVDRPFEFWEQARQLRNSGGLYVVILLVLSALSQALGRRLRPDTGAPPATGWRGRAITVLSTIGVLSAALVDLVAGGLTGGGFLVAAAGGAVALRDPRDRSAEPAAAPAPKKAETLAMLLLGSLLISGCATARTASGAGAAAGLDCTTPALSAAVDEAAALARAFVLAQIGGDGKVDGAALRAAARQLKSDALRCSLVAAIAAIAALAEEPHPRRLMATQLPPNPAELRAVARQIEVDWGIDVKVSP